MKTKRATMLALAGGLLTLGAWNTALAEPAAAPASAPAKAAAPAADLPSGKEVLENYIKAIGGREKLEAIKTRQMTMKMEIPAQGLSATINSFQKAPGLSFNETELAGMGKFLQGSDGEVAWESNPMMGPRILEGEEKAAFLRSVRSNAEYAFDEFYKEFTTIGKEKVGDAEAFAVKMVTNEDQTETRLFDVKTGLLLASRSTQPSQMGDIKIETLFSDYREVEGVKIPFSQTVKMAGTEMKSVVEKADFNTDIPDTKFALPADVKALLDAQKKPAPADKPANP